MRLRLAHGLLLLVILGLLAATASGERSQKGVLISALDGRISPNFLPRQRPAPVTFHLEGNLHTEDGSLLPKVRRLELAIAGSGKLETRGLPICPRRLLRDTRPDEALAVCRSALVGRGRVEAVAVVPRQLPSEIRAQLLAFNGRTREGGRAILLHVYSAQPPISLVIPFAIRRHPGSFHTALVADLSAALGPLPRFAGVEVELGRSFRYRGRQRSYLSASCPLPQSLSVGFLPIARATYTLAGGRRLSTEIVRGCRVR
jgi:hypothetical protein